MIKVMCQCISRAFNTESRDEKGVLQIDLNLLLLSLTVTSSVCRQKDMLADLSASSVTMLLGECTSRLLDQKFIRVAGQSEGAKSSVVVLEQNVVDTMNR